MDISNFSSEDLAACDYASYQLVISSHPTTTLLNTPTLTTDFDTSDASSSPSSSLCHELSPTAFEAEKLPDHTGYPDKGLSRIPIVSNLGSAPTGTSPTSTWLEYVLNDNDQSLAPISSQQQTSYDHAIPTLSSNTDHALPHPLALPKTFEQACPPRESPHAYQERREDIGTALHATNSDHGATISPSDGLDGHSQATPLLPQ